MKPLLEPLAMVFKWGVQIRFAAYRRGWLKTHRLDRLVISVGNLSVGGTGKTPLVARIARRLIAGGWKPAILTRGYGRRGNDLIVLAPGPSASRRVDPRRVGDEPACLARTLPEVPVIVGADRFRGGVLAEKTFSVDVHLLDDGFQHLALARDLDIVLIDVTQEFSDRALLPAGRLREPCAALQRADAIVLTRVDLGDAHKVEEKVRRIHPRAPIFHSVNRLCGLVEVGSGKACEPGSLLGKKVWAFCGIGTPQGFFADLRKWKFSLAGGTAFPDHHVYDATELSRIVRRARDAGAEVLITTEKDSVNFPSTWNLEMPVMTCNAQPEVHEWEAFETTWLARLQADRKRKSRPWVDVATAGGPNS